MIKERTILLDDLLIQIRLNLPNNYLPNFEINEILNGFSYIKRQENNQIEIKDSLVDFDKNIVANLRALNYQIFYPKKYNFDILKECPFQKRDLSHYKNYETAYHQLMLDLVEQQVFSTNLVIHNSPVKKIFVDGGFSKNSIYMNLLAEAFPDVEVYAASMAQASALGAALAIHDNWNPKPIQNDLIDLKFYKH